MKKFLSIVAIATLFCAVAFAQEDGNRDADGKIVRGPYASNGSSFWDNTFIELQGGVDFIGACHMGRNNGGKSIYPGLALGANVGKWFSPVLGLRLGWEGLTGQWKPGSAIPGSDGNTIRKYNHHYAHADFMVNISNWFSGYKETRVWDVIPYIHAGYLNFKRVDVNADAAGRFAAGVGLYNRFRITNRFGLSLDLRGVISDNSVLGGEFKSSVTGYSDNNFTQKAAGYVSALAGLYVNLGTTGWHRVNNAPLDIPCESPATVQNEHAEVLAAQDKAEAAVKASAEQQEAAAAAYLKALEDIDIYGRVSASAYQKAGVEEEVAAAFATIANVEDCPDFTTYTKAEMKEWTKNHKAVLPEGWDKLTNDEKNQWVLDAIYAPAEKAAAVKEAAEKDLVAANKALEDACKDCNDAVLKAQNLVDKYSKMVDANGNILPGCYPDVDPATAQRYADIYNTYGCVDFTSYTCKDHSQFKKANKDVLPKDWNKMNYIQKTQWYKTNICCPAELAKANAAFAEQELEKAKARKVAQDLAYENAQKPIIPTGPVPKLQDVEAVGFFTIGHSQFNDKQMANWKKAIEGVDKRCDYIVTGYADQETGSAERNAQLRQERCEYVKGLMKVEGFTGTITARPSGAEERFVNAPIWKNRSAVIR